MFIPYKAEVEVLVNPVSNLFIIGLNIFFYVFVFFEFVSINPFILDGYNVSLISHGFMHGNWAHLLGNMFYLFIFGGAVCSRIGNANYPTIFFVLIVCSGTIHLIFDGAPAIGASGAVNGIIGMYLFLYPRSRIKCAWTVIWAAGKTFSIRAYWLIGFWFLSDVFGLIQSNAPIAYVAHIGGLITGIFIGWFMYKNNWIKRTCEQPSLAKLMNNGS